MSWELFRVEQDEAYHKGLRWWYHVDLGDASRLVEQLQRQHPGLRVSVEEFWGPNPVVRVVWPFRFEVRIGEREGVVTFRHRACVAGELQAQDRATFEGALISALLAERATKRAG